MTVSTLEKQKIWMILNHPQEMATALTMASHWGREKFVLNLLISCHPYWRKVAITPYEHQFDNIVFLDRPDYVPGPFPQPGRILRSLRLGKRVAQLKGQPASVAIGQLILLRLQTILLYPMHVFGMIVKILRVKKRVARLGIQQDDILIWLTIGHFVDNIVLSTHPQNLKIAVIISEVYQRCTKPIDKDIYRNTFEGWVANWLIEPITGLRRTYCVKDRLHSELPWLVRYRGSLSEIYDKIVVLGDFSEQTGDNIITMPYPYVLAITKTGGNYSSTKPKKVVFFGSKFIGAVAGIIDPEIYARHLNSCLAFVREKYGSACKLVYRPHPRESDIAGSLDLSQFEDETRLLNLDQFEIENDGMLAELYFYRNMENIQAVFSVESTSSRSAFHFFINAYSFLNIFPYDERMKEFFRRFIGKVPDDFYIDDLSIMPNRYVKTEDINEATKKCRDVLDAVIRK